MIQSQENHEYRKCKSKDFISVDLSGLLCGKTLGYDFVPTGLPPSAFTFLSSSYCSLSWARNHNFSYEEQDLNNTFAPPGANLFSEQTTGTDLFARVLHGGGFSWQWISCNNGLPPHRSGLWDDLRLPGGKIDADDASGGYSLLLTFTIFVILLMVLFGRNFILLFIAIGAVEWLTMARITRGQTLSLKQAEFIEAARALGYSHSRILFRHILPNLLGPVIVYATLTVPAVMLLEAVLSFLGLGVQAPMSSWGSLIKEGSEKMEIAPWLIFFPGLFFSLTLLALNFLGDGLRDALDPKAAKD